MPILVDGLTVTDLTEAGWRVVIAGVDERDCMSYMSAFLAKAEEMSAAGDETKAKVFELLQHLTSMSISLDDAVDPLKPLFRGPHSRTAMASDFDGPAVDLLADFLPHIDDDELTARVADLIWLRKRNFKAARTAAMAYINVAGLGQRKQWRNATVRLERAIEIAAHSNQRDLIDTAVQHVEAALASSSGSEISFLPFRLMRILLGRKAGDPAKYAILSGAFAMAGETRRDWHYAREYWLLQADWLRAAKDNAQEQSARFRAAETYVKDAESRANDQNPDRSFIAATHLIELAIHSLRKVEGQSERIEQLHRQLLEYQEKSNVEMQTHSHEYDASALIAGATEQVAGKSLYDAILALGLVAWPPQIANLRAQAERQREDSILELIGVTRYTNAMGRTVARRDPPEEGESQHEADIRIEMYKVAGLSHTIHVQSMIYPALQQILREHSVSEDDVRSIVRNNPFVPEGRQEFYVRGIHAGFRQDWVVAAHLLIPQVENSIRHVLRELSVITSGLDDDFIQDERNLNCTLRSPEFAEPLKKVFGEDLLFDLRGLLIERYGSNLRNDMAHGLLDYSAFASVPCVYLWWLTLHILCMPIIGAIRAAEQANVSTTEMDTTQEAVGETVGEEEETGG